MISGSVKVWKHNKSSEYKIEINFFRRNKKKQHEKMPTITTAAAVATSDDAMVKLKY